MTDQDHLERINALTRNARTTWFALLAALVFVGVTLMSVEHIDFYGVDRATQLPLVNVAVPTRYFFVASPILIAAIYGYFHLYLIRLWDALGTAPARLGGIRLGDAVTPWLVTDAALHLRRRMRGDNATTPRTLEGGAMLLNILLAWGFGLVVLIALWWMSMPARAVWMTGIAGLCLFVSLFAGGASVAMMVLRLKDKDQTRHNNIFASAPPMAAMIALIPLIAVLSFEKTSGSPDRLARLDLSGETIIERPPGWLSRQDARAEFRAEWCRREFIEDCGDLGQRESDFSDEFDRRRGAAIADMRRPDWDRPPPAKTEMNFRLADLPNSFLVGANLWRAQMEGANLSRAQMEDAYLNWAQMEGAVLRGAQMERADLRGAQMEGADLRLAQMERADLSEAQMERADLNGAQMKEADLRGAQMEGAVLRGAQMERALLHFSQLTGTKENVTELVDTNLSMSINRGGILRFVDLSNVVFDAATDFRNTFLDGTVTMTPAFRAQMGRPCQWAEGVLDDAEFYGRWRGWIDANPSQGFFESWDMVGPAAYSEVAPIPPPPGCEWKTGPIAQAQQD